MDYKKAFTLTEVTKGYIIKKYKEKDTVVEIPETINDKKVVAIGETAFKGKDIEEIVLPNSLIAIGERAFCDCKNLKKVTLESGVAIDRFAFSGCESLADENGYVVVNGILFEYYGQDSSIVIPDKVRIIDDSAFEKIKKSLVSVVIHENVEELRCNAFYGCKKLTSVTVNPEKTRIDSSAFDECKGLIDGKGFIIFKDYLCVYRSENTDTEELVIPQNIRRIGSQVIGYQPKLRTIEIPEGVETIDALAFSFTSSLETVHIPSSVTSIAGDAFRGCSRVSIVAPKGCYAIQFAKENNIPYTET